MSNFKWWFKQPTIKALYDALAETGGYGFELHPENSDGSPLTDEQIKMLGGLSIKMHVPLPPAPVQPSIVLNDSFPCPPICAD